MPIPAEVEQLLILQNHDQKLRRLDRELRQIPTEIHTLENKLRQAGEAAHSVKNRIQEAEVQRNKLDVEVRAKQDAINKFKSQQQQTRKNEEYQALSHEIARFQKDITALEDRELEIMMAIDSLKSEMAAAEHVLSQEKGAIDGEIDSLNKKKSALEEQRQLTTAKRDEAASSVDPSLLGMYDRLLKNKGDAVVVPAEHDTCMGCHMRLTTQTTVRVRSANGIVQCENCGRILYDGAA